MESKKNTAVIYKSKYGSAKRYAEWIAEEVGADLYESSKTNLGKLLKYDTIVYGGSLYAAGIIGFGLIKDNFDKIKDKNLIVFSVGASPAREKALNDVRDHNFSATMKKKITYFHLRGAFNYSRLNLIDKLLMSLMKFNLRRKKPEDLDEDAKGLLAAYDTPVDWTDKKAIAPIIDCIKRASTL